MDGPERKSRNKKSSVIRHYNKYGIDIQKTSKHRKEYYSAWHKERYQRKAYPYMSQLWYPAARQDPFKDSGGFLSGYEWRGVLHTTEGSSYAGARAAYAAGKAPHFTVSFERGVFQAWQHIPINKSARALANPAGGVETNRARCIQIEIVGNAATSGALQREYLNGLGKLMRWIEANTGIKRHATNFYGPGAGIILARADSPIRFTGPQWKSFSGWCGHQHVPENAHWDPGTIDINYLLSVDIGVTPVINPPMDFTDVVDIRQDKYTPEGVYILQKDGAVFAYRGAVFYLGVNGQDFFAGRDAAGLLYPDEYQQLTGSQPHPNHKYFVQATSGELYACPWRDA